MKLKNIFFVFCGLLVFESSAIARCYTVKKNDTLYSISVKLNSTVTSLMKTNQIKNASNIRIGQKICSSDSKISSYTVQKGDTLFSISQRSKTPVATIKSLNNLKGNDISVGQVLKIPSSTEDTRKKNIKIIKKSSGSKKSFMPSSALPYSGKCINPIVVSAPAKPKLSSFSISNSRKLSFSWPLRGKIEKTFGKNSKKARDDGIVISTCFNSAVKAAESGSVIYVGKELKAYGRIIIVQHNKTLLSVYGHINKPFVVEGEKVKRGQVIASSGMQPISLRQSLFFSIRTIDKPLNPIQKLPKLDI